MKKNTVKISGKEYPIFCSTEAFSEIGALCDGKIEDLPKILALKGKSISEAAKIIGMIIEVLINGEIKRKNFAIESGFEDGEKEKILPSGMIITMAQPKEIVKEENQEAILKAITESTVYEVPDDVPLTKKEVDLDLEEIREEKAKKAESAE